MTDSTISISDLDAITAVLTTYLEGAKSGRSDGLRQVFSPQASIYGYVGKELAFNGPIDPLFAWNEGNGASPQVQGRITHVDVIGNVASAKIESENWAGAKFTDFMLLLKVDSDWKIMNKVFHLH